MSTLWPEMTFRGDLLDHEDPVEITKKTGYLVPNKEKRKQQTKAEAQTIGGVSAIGAGAGLAKPGYRNLQAGGRAAASSVRARNAGVAEETSANPYKTKVRQTGSKPASKAPGKSVQPFKRSYGSANPNPEHAAKMRQAGGYFRTAAEHGGAARRLRTKGGALLAGSAGLIGGGAALAHHGSKNYTESLRKPRYVAKAFWTKRSPEHKAKLKRLKTNKQQAFRRYDQGESAAHDSAAYKARSQHKWAASGLDTAASLLGSQMRYGFAEGNQAAMKYGKSPEGRSAGQGVVRANTAYRKGKKTLHKSWDVIEKRDRKIHHSIEQSERLAGRARQRQKRSIQAAGVGATGIGIASAFGNVPHQSHTIIHSAREGKNLAGGFRQVAGAARRNPAGAVALGSAAFGAAALGSWAANRGIESSHLARADRRRRRNYYHQKTSVHKAWSSDRYHSRRAASHWRRAGKQFERGDKKYDKGFKHADKSFSHESKVSDYKKLDHLPHGRSAQVSNRLARHKKVEKAFPFKRTTQAARATNEAAQKMAGSATHTSEKIGHLSDKAGRLTDKVSNLVPRTKLGAAGLGVGLATAAGTPSGIGAYLGNRPNRRAKTSKASPSSPDVSSKGVLKPISRRKPRAAS